MTRYVHIVKQVSLESSNFILKLNVYDVYEIYFVSHWESVFKKLVPKIRQWESIDPKILYFCIGFHVIGFAMPRERGNRKFGPSYWQKYKFLMAKIWL